MTHYRMAPATHLVIRALLAASEALSAKAKPVPHTAESATKYRADKGRCPRGWKYSYTSQTCVPKPESKPKDPNAPPKVKAKAAVQKKAPQIEGASKGVNAQLAALHKDSVSGARLPPGSDYEAPVRRSDSELKAFKETADDAATEWWVGLPEEEGEAIRDYTAEGFTSINNFLRGKAAKAEMDRKFPQYATPPDPKLVEKAKKISSALSKASLPEPAVVFRGTVNPDLVDRFNKGSLVNGSVKTDQFYSTSVDPKAGDAFLSYEEEADDDGKRAPKAGRVLWNIKVPKGAKAAYVDSVSDHEGEHEVLMNEGSELRITGATMKDGVLHLEAEYRAE